MQQANLFDKAEKPLVSSTVPHNAEEPMAETTLLQTEERDIVAMLRFSTCYPNFFIDQSLFR
ncbi:MAG: hypothetical protein WCD18_13690 [Thermosynechococcaceae cyanobacterium]